MPEPLAGFKHGEHSIWGKTFTISFYDKILLNASSGKGKTTLISILLGLRKDYSGSVFIQEQNIQNLDVETWTKLRREVFSVVFQDLQLLSQLSLEENLRIKHDLGSDLIFDEVLELIQALGLGDKLKQTCGTLSFGQQQRVAIVRALIPSFDFLLMDEPFSHLDTENTEHALTLILKRCDNLNSGCLLTTLGETYNNRFDQMLYL